MSKTCIKRRKKSFSVGGKSMFGTRLAYLASFMPSCRSRLGKPFPITEAFSSGYPMRSFSSVVVAFLSVSAMSSTTCEKLSHSNLCKTAFTSEANPVDHRGRPMWSWTADQLRQVGATEFWRLADGTMSTRFLIERGADLDMTERLLWCKPSELPFDDEHDGFALSERRRSERVSGFSLPAIYLASFLQVLQASYQLAASY